MSTEAEEAILKDALIALGIRNINLFQIRSLSAFKHGCFGLKFVNFDTARATFKLLRMRLLHDMRSETLEQVHSGALYLESLHSDPVRSLLGDAMRQLNDQED